MKNKSMNLAVQILPSRHIQSNSSYITLQTSYGTPKTRCVYFKNAPKTFPSNQNLFYVLLRAFSNRVPWLPPNYYNGLKNNELWPNFQARILPLWVYYLLVDSFGTCQRGARLGLACWELKLLSFSEEGTIDSSISGWLLSLQSGSRMPYITRRGTFSVFWDEIKTEVLDDHRELCIYELDRLDSWRKSTQGQTIKRRQMATFSKPVKSDPGTSTWRPSGEVWTASKYGGVHPLAACRCRGS